MAEEEEKDGKTEEATDQRLKSAVEKGDIPVSRELGIIMPLAASFICIAAMAQGPASDLARFLALCLDRSGEVPLEGNVSRLFLTIVEQSAFVVLPFVGILMLFGILGAVIQNQPRFVVDRIQPQINRVSITKGFKRIFGVNGLIEFAKSCVKCLLLALVSYYFLRGEFASFLAATGTDPNLLPSLTYNLCLKLLLSFILAGVVLAAADFAWVRFSWRRKLRMTRQEVKDEHKEMEGNPYVKSRLRALARDRARRRMLAAVPKATVVIANPTHFAVALRYERGAGGAPVVVAKGQDLIALKIRGIAEAHGVPVVEDKPLARSLYNSVQVDGMIPPEFYRAVAKIILFIGTRGK